jgi:hypothetical protein
MQTTFGSEITVLHLLAGKNSHIKRAGRCCAIAFLCGEGIGHTHEIPDLPLNHTIYKPRGR